MRSPHPPAHLLRALRFGDSGRHRHRISYRFECRILEAAGMACAALDVHGRSLVGRGFVPFRSWRLLRRERPPVVHFQHALTLNLGGLAARLARVPRIVMTEHTEEQFKQMGAYRIDRGFRLPWATACR